MINTFNYGETLRKWIRIFYTDAEACVLNNGWTTQIFKLTKGARQGCPLSPYLFIICAEILACMIRQNTEIEGIYINGYNYLINQYTDDTNIFIKYEENSLRQVLNTFKLFQLISGLKVNLDKTEIVPLGPIRKHYTVLMEEEPMKWTTEPIKCLGITVSTDKEELINLNYKPVIFKIEHLIKFWNKQYMTLFGKVVIINAVLISQLVYIMSVLPTPPLEIFKQVDKRLYTFLWSNKTERVKRTILKNSKNVGGLGMPDITIKNTALKISWVKRMQNAKHLEIFVYRTTWIQNQDIWKCNINQNDIKILFKTTPNAFVKDIIQAWAKYAFTTP